MRLVDRELRRAIAKASLRQNWRRAEESGASQMGPEEIDQEIEREIDRVRAVRQRRKRR